MNYRRCRGRLAVVAILLTATAAHAADAQLGVGADLTLRSEYVWRGLTRSSGPVLQPGLFVAWQPRGWTFTAGSWANLELWRAGPNDLSDADPGERLTELDYWAEAHTRLRDFDLRAGVVRYDFRAESTAGISHDRFDTTELYAAVSRLVTDRLQLGGSVAFDLGPIDGAYVTLRALRNFPVVHFHGWLASLHLDAETGVSFGHERDAEAPLEPAYFERGGVTHLRGGAAARLHTDRFAPYLAVQFQSNGDAQTRRASATSSGSHKIWLELGLSYLLGSLAQENR